MLEINCIRHPNGDAVPSYNDLLRAAIPGTVTIRRSQSTGMLWISNDSGLHLSLENAGKFYGQTDGEDRSADERSEVVEHEVNPPYIVGRTYIDSRSPRGCITLCRDCALFLNVRPEDEVLCLGIHTTNCSQCGRSVQSPDNNAYLQNTEADNAD